MNGFEPLRRRVIDYTVAGQWQEVYDGPIEECEEFRLQAENAKLRELARDLRLCSRESNCLKCSHGRFCDLRLDERCAELGIEVGA